MSLAFCPEKAEEALPLISDSSEEYEASVSMGRAVGAGSGFPLTQLVDTNDKCQTDGVRTSVDRIRSDSISNSGLHRPFSFLELYIWSQALVGEWDFSPLLTLVVSVLVRQQFSVSAISSPGESVPSVLEASNHSFPSLVSRTVPVLMF